MILNSIEIEKITSWAKKKADVHLELIVTKDLRSKEYHAFCDLLTEYASNIIVKIIKDFDKKEPFIKIKENLIYQAIPKGKELEIFLELLTYNKDSKDGYCLNENVPAFLKVYISEYCPFCPVVVREMALLAIDNKNVIVTIVDGVLLHEKAHEDKVKSVPTVIFDDNIRWTGAVNTQDVIEVITNIQPEQLSFNALKTMIESGNASYLATLMMNVNKVFPFYYELVTHEKWPIRLGAMVVMEHIADEKYTLAREILDELWNRFDNVSTSVKGDIIYLTGETGHMGDMERIQSDFSNELQEAAEDAKNSLLERHKS